MQTWKHSGGGGLRFWHQESLLDWWDYSSITNRDASFRLQGLESSVASTGKLGSTIAIALGSIAIFVIMVVAIIMIRRKNPRNSVAHGYVEVSILFFFAPFLWSFYPFSLSVCRWQNEQSLWCGMDCSFFIIIFLSILLFSLFLFHMHSSGDLIEQPLHNRHG